MAHCLHHQDVGMPLQSNGLQGLGRTVEVRIEDYLVRFHLVACFRHFFPSDVQTYVINFKRVVGRLENAVHVQLIEVIVHGPDNNLVSLRGTECYAVFLIDKYLWMIN